ncbi:MAG: sigma 54-interacting transcriptional regulator [Candidatus Pacebacteria bacterium]|nr:sigma 54-interacting transcriptional regulator [Candidatus Paceibacterota bacterium]
MDSTMRKSFLTLARCPERETVACPAQLNLTKERLTVGRAANSDARLQQKSVSRNHAMIRRRDNHFLVVDLASSNGTCINGIRVLQQQLKDGDTVTFGDVEYVFHQCDEPPEASDEAPEGAQFEATVDLGSETRGQEEHAVPGDAVQECGIVGRSCALMDAVRTTMRAAATDATVLIRGESGTGKELLARLIVNESARNTKRFIPVACSAIDPNIMGSTLFGHEKGAFTGAIGLKKGVFEEAHGGTVFLDEIGELELAMQVKLLRVLQEGEITRVGGVNPIPVDVRIIAATNRDLETALKGGHFREELYYRLKVIEITLPPLRERIEDIPDLAKFFMEECRQSFSSPVHGIGPDAIRALQRYSWPGNVRELRNVIERSMVLADASTLSVSDLPGEIVDGPKDRGLDADSLSGNATLEDVERAYIKKVLEKCENNKQRAAKQLGISRSTLYEKLREIGTRKDT